MKIGNHQREQDSQSTFRSVLSHPFIPQTCCYFGCSFLKTNCFPWLGGGGTLTGNSNENEMSKHCCIGGGRSNMELAYFWENEPLQQRKLERAMYRIAKMCEQKSLRKWDVKKRLGGRSKVGKAMECIFRIWLMMHLSLHHFSIPSSRLSWEETRIICLHYIIQIVCVSLHCKSNQYPLAACMLPVML